MIKNCLVCLEENPKFLTDYHSCQICKPCVIQWVQEKIKLQDSDHIPCLIDGCKDQFQMNDIHKQLDSDPKFQEIMFQNYIRKEKDIRPCPRLGCQGYAFVPEKRCSQDLQCPTCNFEWMDRNFLSYSYQIYLFFKEIKNETSTAIVEFFCTQLCPKCESNIWKNGGCTHMTCKKCSFYFCWLCKSELNKHKNPLCASRFILLALLLITFILNFMYSAGILFIFGYLCYPFIYLYYFIMYNIILVIPVVEVYLAICVYEDYKVFVNTKKQYRYKLYDVFIGLFIMLFCTVSEYGLWNLLDVIGFQETLLQYQMYQLSIVGSVISIGYGLHFIKTLWQKRKTRGIKVKKLS